MLQLCVLHTIEARLKHAAFMTFSQFIQYFYHAMSDPPKSHLLNELDDWFTSEPPAFTPQTHLPPPPFMVIFLLVSCIT